MIFRFSLIAVVLTAGCDGDPNLPDLGRVSGVVTVDGKPLSNAIVTFTPQGEGRPSVSETDGSGRYELLYKVDTEGAMTGTHVVRVQLIQEDDADSGAGEGQDGTETGLPPAATDGSITKDVKAGSNEIDIEL